MTDNKCYVVKSIRLMMYLVRKGFNVVNVIDDVNNPKYKVFCFSDCHELQKAINTFSKM